jgi:hypothetical protein
MPRAAIALLLLTGLACAQVIVPPANLARVRRDFEPGPGEESLRCEVTPIPPAINFAFRFEAGYTFRVPRSQYTSPPEAWMVLVAITPEHGEPTYLAARTPLAKAPVAESEFTIRGGFILGAGRYSIESTLRDDRHRVCRQHWNVVVAPSHSDRGVPLALPPHSIRELSSVSVPDVSHPDDAAPMRIAILLNAAAFSTRRVVIGERDRQRFAQALTALIEHLPAMSVSVVVFSLEQQKEVFRASSFQPRDIARVSDAIATTPQTSVDVSLLKNPLGHVEFLAGLIRRELDPPDPADTVIFFGPTSRYWDTGPKGTLPAVAEPHTRFFYVRYEAFQLPIIPAELPPLGSIEHHAASPQPIAIPPLPRDPSRGQPDIISRAVAQLNGKTMIIHSPAELADAIRKIEGQH